MASSEARGMYAAVLATGLALAGCFGTKTTTFPPGLAPWDSTNAAPLPTATATDMFPEQLTFVRQMYNYAVGDAMTMPINSVHARAYLKTTMTAAWAAARDPQTGRDPTSSQGFAVLAYQTDTTYPFSFRTHVVVTSPITLEWDVEWRHGVIDGPTDNPLITATRWQKTGGTDIINVIEGSLVLRAVPGQSAVTEVQYQYHLDSFGSDHGTIENYLRSIFSRLKDRAHAITLNPNDCMGCPTPPAGY